MSTLTELIQTAEKLDYVVKTLTMNSITLGFYSGHVFGSESKTVTIEDSTGLRADFLELVLADAGRFYYKRDKPR